MDLVKYVSDLRQAAEFYKENCPAYPDVVATYRKSADIIEELIHDGKNDEKPSMDEKIQFEYWWYKHVWEIDIQDYVQYGVKKCLTVLDTFEHHYTGERMCRIREEWLAENGIGMADERIVTEEIVLKLWEKSKGDV